MYMEPDKLGLSQSSGFDIYVDDTGYAVPHRLVKKSKSSTSTDSEVFLTRVLFTFLFFHPCTKNPGFFTAQRNTGKPLENIEGKRKFNLH